MTVLSLQNDEAFVEELVLAGVDATVVPAPEGFATLPLPLQVEGLTGEVVWQPTPGTAQVVWILEYRNVARTVSVDEGPGSDAQLAILVREMLAVPPEPLPDEAQPDFTPPPQEPMIDDRWTARWALGPHASLTPTAPWPRLGAEVNLLPYERRASPMLGAELGVGTGRDLQRLRAGADWVIGGTPLQGRVGVSGSWSRIVVDEHSESRWAPHLRAGVDWGLERGWVGVRLGWNPVREQVVHVQDGMVWDGGRWEASIVFGGTRKVSAP